MTDLFSEYPINIGDKFTLSNKRLYRLEDTDWYEKSQRLFYVLQMSNNFFFIHFYNSIRNLIFTHN